MSKTNKHISHEKITPSLSCEKTLKYTPLNTKNWRSNKCKLGMVRFSYIFGSWGFITTFCPIICLCFLSSMLWCPLQYPHKNDVRFVFACSVLKECSCLIYVICACLPNGVQHILIIWVTLWVSYKRHELLALRGRLGSPRFLVGSVVLIFLAFCVVFFVLFVFVLYLVCPMLAVSMDCPFLIASSVFPNLYLNPCIVSIQEMKTRDSNFMCKIWIIEISKLLTYSG